MKKSKKFLGALGLVGVVVPSIITLSCKAENKQQTEVVDTTIKVKNSNFNSTDLGFEATKKADEALTEITVDWIHSKLNTLFTNADANKITKDDIKIINKTKTSDVEVFVSLKIQDVPLEFRIKGFKIEAKQDEFIARATEFSADAFGLADKTAEEAKSLINKEWVKTNKDIIFSSIDNTTLDKLSHNITTTVIGNSIYVTLSSKGWTNSQQPSESSQKQTQTEEKTISFNFEIKNFKEQTQTPGVPENSIVNQIKGDIVKESSEFNELKNKLINEVDSVITESWLLSKQNAIFETSELKSGDITINRKGPEQNNFIVDLTILQKKSVKLTITNFIPSVKIKESNFDAKVLGFEKVIPSDANITKELIFANFNKLFNIVGVIVIDDIKSVTSTVSQDKVNVKLTILNKEFNFTISGFKDKYIVAQRTEFDIKELDVKTNGDRKVSTFITHMTNLVKGEGVMKDNHKILLSSYGLTTGSGIKVTKITTKLTGSGSVQVTVEFDNNIDKTTFKVKGLEQDVTYIKHVQATTIYATSTLYKFKFVITGEKLPTSKFVNNFRVKRVTYKTDGTPIYTDTYRNYWGYTKVKQTAEKIEVEITKTGVWKPGDVMVIHRAGRDVSEGFQLTLPW